MRRLLAVAVAVMAATGAFAADRRAIDPGRSSVTIRAFKEGFLSAFAHDHEVKAPVTSGWVERTGAPGVEVRFATRALQVLDPELSESKRASVRETMLGAQVLDAEHYPEIVFRSTSVAPHGDASFSIDGELTLHGKTKPVRLDVSVKEDRFHGSVAFLQTDFGITPIRIAGGSIRVKDEVRVELDIALVAP